MTSTPDNTDGGGAPNSQPPVSGGGNYYHARLEAEQPPDLDANAPLLKASDMRRLNRRALGFMAALVVVIGLIAAWMFNSFISSGKSQPKPREEVVNVPAAPRPPPPTQSAPPPEKAQPIAVAPMQSLPPLPPLPPVPEAPRGPTLLERRMMDTNNAVAVGVSPMQPGGLPAMPPEWAASAAALDTPPEFAMPANKAYKAPALANVANAQPLIHPDTVMTRGTYIRCVLETHIVTDVPGFTSCIVTEPVYSFTGKRLLLPKGSKVLGKYDMESNSDRVAVVWDRVITPTGIDVNMASPGIDNLGGAGHPGYRDEHWFERIRAALLISILSDAFKYEAAKHGPQTATVTNGVVVESPFESNTAKTLQDLANQAVRRSANRPDTITINQGTVVYVYVAKDIDFAGVLARS